MGDAADRFTTGVDQRGRTFNGSPVVDFHSDRKKIVAHTVVKFTCHPAALVFKTFDILPGQLTVSIGAQC